MRWSVRSGRIVVAPSEITREAIDDDGEKGSEEEGQDTGMRNSGLRVDRMVKLYSMFHSVDREAVRHRSDWDLNYILVVCCYSFSSERSTDCTSCSPLLDRETMRHRSDGWLN